jgi:hypothetical protein
VVVAEAASGTYDISEATFGDYFTLSPSNDPCAVNEYSLQSSPGTDWNGFDTTAFIDGSFGSLVFKIDLT